MNYFIYQPPRLDDADIIYCNAELINDSRKRVEVYSMIAKIHDEVRLKSYPWFGKKNGYYVLKGLFNAKDEKGRTMSFFFASNDDDYENILACIAEKIGYDIGLSTQQLMEDYLKEKKRNQFIKCGLVILSLVLLMLAFFCLMNNA